MGTKYKEAPVPLLKQDEQENGFQEYWEAIGQRVKNLRQDRGLSQTDLAKRAGVPRNILYNLEKTKRSVATLTTLRKVADGLQVPIEFVLKPSLMISKTMLDNWKVSPPVQPTIDEIRRGLAVLSAQGLRRKVKKIYLRRITRLSNYFRIICQVDGEVLSKKNRPSTAAQQQPSQLSELEQVIPGACAINPLLPEFFRRISPFGVAVTSLLIDRLPKGVEEWLQEHPGIVDIVFLTVDAAVYRVGISWEGLGTVQYGLNVSWVIGPKGMDTFVGGVWQGGEDLKSAYYDSGRIRQLNNLAFGAFQRVAAAQGKLINPTQIEAAHLLTMRCGAQGSQGIATQQDTAEGKTEAIAMAAYAETQRGKRVHVVTFNSYLAYDGANRMASLLGELGVSVGLVIEFGRSYALWDPYKKQWRSIKPQQRRKVLNASVVYGAYTEFIPEYLSYQAEQRIFPLADRALIDELDAILVDDATTPVELTALVSSKPNPIPQYIQDIYQAVTALAEAGEAGIDPLTGELYWKDGSLLRLKFELRQHGVISISSERLRQLAEVAIIALHLHQGYDYEIEKGKLLPIHPATRRPRHHYHFSRDLELMLGIKENLSLGGSRRLLGSILPRSYFNLYPERFSGTSATLLDVQKELRESLRLDVHCFPPQYTYPRKHQFRFVKDQQTADAVLLERAIQAFTAKQPLIVIGVAPNDARRCSELLQAFLGFIPREQLSDKKRILVEGKADSLALIRKDTQVIPTLEIGLACDLEGFKREAEVFQQAGCVEYINGYWKIFLTVATGMIVRGVDIRLNSLAKKQGGAHLIFLGSLGIRRHDLQVLRRIGRSSDEPATTLQIISLDDALVQRFLRAEDKGTVEELIQLALERAEAYASDQRQDTLQQLQLREDLIRRLLGYQPTIPLPDHPTRVERYSDMVRQLSNNAAQGHTLQYQIQNIITIFLEMASRYEREPNYQNIYLDLYALAVRAIENLRDSLALSEQEAALRAVPQSGFSQRLQQFLKEGIWNVRRLGEKLKGSAMGVCRFLNQHQYERKLLIGQAIQWIESQSQAGQSVKKEDLAYQIGITVYSLYSSWFVRDPELYEAFIRNKQLLGEDIRLLGRAEYRSRLRGLLEEGIWHLPTLAKRLQSSTFKVSQELWAKDKDGWLIMFVIQQALIWIEKQSDEVSVRQLAGKFGVHYDTLRYAWFPRAPVLLITLQEHNQAVRERKHLEAAAKPQDTVNHPDGSRRQGGASSPAVRREHEALRQVYWQEQERGPCKVVRQEAVLGQPLLAVKFYFDAPDQGEQLIPAGRLLRPLEVKDRAAFCRDHLLRNKLLEALLDAQVIDYYEYEPMSEAGRSVLRKEKIRARYAEYRKTAAVLSLNQKQFLRNAKILYSRLRGPYPYSESELFTFVLLHRLKTPQSLSIIQAFKARWSKDARLLAKQRKRPGQQKSAQLEAVDFSAAKKRARQEIRVAQALNQRCADLEEYLQGAPWDLVRELLDSDEQALLSKDRQQLSSDISAAIMLWLFYPPSQLDLQRRAKIFMSLRIPVLVKSRFVSEHPGLVAEQVQAYEDQVQDFLEAVNDFSPKDLIYYLEKTIKQGSWSLPGLPQQTLLQWVYESLDFIRAVVKVRRVYYTVRYKLGTEPAPEEIASQMTIPTGYGYLISAGDISYIAGLIGLKLAPSKQKDVGVLKRQRAGYDARLLAGRLARRQASDAKRAKVSELVAPGSRVNLRALAKDAGLKIESLIHFFWENNRRLAIQYAAQQLLPALLEKAELGVIISPEDLANMMGITPESLKRRWLRGIPELLQALTGAQLLAREVQEQKAATGLGSSPLSNFLFNRFKRPGIELSKNTACASPSTWSRASSPVGKNTRGEGRRLRGENPKGILRILLDTHTAPMLLWDELRQYLPKIFWIEWNEGVVYWAQKVSQGESTPREAFEAIVTQLQHQGITLEWRMTQRLKNDLEALDCKQIELHPEPQWSEAVKRYYSESVDHLSLANKIFLIGGDFEQAQELLLSYLKTEQLFQKVREQGIWQDWIQLFGQPSEDKRLIMLGAYHESLARQLQEYLYQKYQTPVVIVNPIRGPDLIQNQLLRMQLPDSLALGSLRLKTLMARFWFETILTSAYRIEAYPGDFLIVLHRVVNRISLEDAKTLGVVVPAIIDKARLAVLRGEAKPETEEGVSVDKPILARILEKAILSWLTEQGKIKRQEAKFFVASSPVKIKKQRLEDLLEKLKGQTLGSIRPRKPLSDEQREKVFQKLSQYVQTQGITEQQLLSFVYNWENGVALADTERFFKIALLAQEKLFQPEAVTELARGLLEGEDEFGWGPTLHQIEMVLEWIVQVRPERINLETFGIILRQLKDPDIFAFEEDRPDVWGFFILLKQYPDVYAQLLAESELAKFYVHKLWTEHIYEANLTEPLISRAIVEKARRLAKAQGQEKIFAEVNQKSFDMQARITPDLEEALADFHSAFSAIDQGLAQTEKPFVFPGFSYYRKFLESQIGARFEPEKVSASQSAEVISAIENILELPCGWLEREDLGRAYRHLSKRYYSVTTQHKKEDSARFRLVREPRILLAAFYDQTREVIKLGKTPKATAMQFADKYLATHAENVFRALVLLAQEDTRWLRGAQVIVNTFDQQLIIRQKGNFVLLTKDDLSNPQNLLGLVSKIKMGLRPQLTLSAEEDKVSSSPVNVQRAVGHSVLVQVSSPVDNEQIRQQAIQRLPPKERKIFHIYDHILSSTQRINEALTRLSSLLSELAVLLETSRGRIFASVPRSLERQQRDSIAASLDETKDILGQLIGTLKPWDELGGEKQIKQARREIGALLDSLESPVAESGLAKSIKSIIVLLEDRLRDLAGQERAFRHKAQSLEEKLQEKINEVKNELRLSGKIIAKKAWSAHIPPMARSYLRQIVDRGLIRAQLAGLGGKITRVKVVLPQGADLKELYIYTDRIGRKFKYPVPNVGEARRTLIDRYGYRKETVSSWERGRVYAVYHKESQMEIIHQAILDMPLQTFVLVNLQASFGVRLVKIGVDVSRFGGRFISLQDEEAVYSGFVVLSSSSPVGVTLSLFIQSLEGNGLGGVIESNDEVVKDILPQEIEPDSQTRGETHDFIQGDIAYFYIKFMQIYRDSASITNCRKYFSTLHIVNSKPERVLSSEDRETRSRIHIDLNRNPDFILGVLYFYVNNRVIFSLVALIGKSDGIYHIKIWTKSSGLGTGRPMGDFLYLVRNSFSTFTILSSLTGYALWLMISTYRPPNFSTSFSKLRFNHFLSSFTILSPSKSKYTLPNLRSQEFNFASVSSSPVKERVSDAPLVKFERHHRRALQLAVAQRLATNEENISIKSNLEGRKDLYGNPKELVISRKGIVAAYLRYVISMLDSREYGIEKIIAAHSFTEGTDLLPLMIAYVAFVYNANELHVSEAREGEEKALNSFVSSGFGTREYSPYPLYAIRLNLGALRSLLFPSFPDIMQDPMPDEIELSVISGQDRVHLVKQTGAELRWPNFAYDVYHKGSRVIPLAMQGFQSKEKGYILPNVVGDRDSHGLILNVDVVDLGETTGQGFGFSIVKFLGEIALGLHLKLRARLTTNPGIMRMWQRITDFRFTDAWVKAALRRLLEEDLNREPIFDSDHARPTEGYTSFYFSPNMTEQAKFAFYAIRQIYYFSFEDFSGPLYVANLVLTRGEEIIKLSSLEYREPNRVKIWTKSERVYLRVSLEDFIFNQDGTIDLRGEHLGRLIAFSGPVDIIGSPLISSSSPVEAFGQSPDDRLRTIGYGRWANGASSPVDYRDKENRAGSPAMNKCGVIGLMAEFIKIFGLVNLVGSLMAQANLFKGYLLKCLFISETGKRIQDLNASKPALRVKIGRYALSKVFGGNGPLFKPNIKGVNLWIIGYPHIISSLEIVNVNGNNNNFVFVFYKYGFYLFSFIFFIIPYLMEREIFFTLQSSQLSLFPAACLDSSVYFFLVATAITGLFFSMLAQSDRLFSIHKNILSSNQNKVNIFIFANLPIAQKLIPVYPLRSSSPVETFGQSPDDRLRTIGYGGWTGEANASHLIGSGLVVGESCDLRLGRVKFTSSPVRKTQRGSQRAVGQLGSRKGGTKKLAEFRGSDFIVSSPANKTEREIYRIGWRRWIQAYQVADKMTEKISHYGVDSGIISDLWDAAPGRLVVESYGQTVIFQDSVLNPKILFSNIAKGTQIELSITIAARNPLKASPLASSPVESLTADLINYGISLKKNAFGLDEVDFFTVPNNVSWVMDKVRSIEFGPIVQEADEMSEVKLIYPLAELPLIGGGHRSQEIFLGLIESGFGKHPAAIKRFFADSFVLAELINAQIHSRIGISPQFYGVVRNENNIIIGYAMQVVIGTNVKYEQNIEDAPGYEQIRERKFDFPSLFPPVEWMITRTGNLVLVDSGVSKFEQGDFFDKLPGMIREVQGDSLPSSSPVKKNGFPDISAWKREIILKVLKEAQARFPSHRYGWGGDLKNPVSRFVLGYESKDMGLDEFPNVYLNVSQFQGFDCLICARWVAAQLQERGIPAFIVPSHNKYWESDIVVEVRNAGVFLSITPGIQPITGLPEFEGEIGLIPEVGFGAGRFTVEQVGAFLEEMRIRGIPIGKGEVDPGAPHKGALSIVSMTVCCLDSKKLRPVVGFILKKTAFAGNRVESSHKIIFLVQVPQYEKIHREIFKVAPSGLLEVLEQSPEVYVDGDYKLNNGFEDYLRTKGDFLYWMIVKFKPELAAEIMEKIRSDRVSSPIKKDFNQGIWPADWAVRQLEWSVLISQNKTALFHALASLDRGRGIYLLAHPEHPLEEEFSYHEESYHHLDLLQGQPQIFIPGILSGSVAEPLGVLKFFIPDWRAYAAAKMKMGSDLKEFWPDVQDSLRSEYIDLSRALIQGGMHEEKPVLLCGSQKLFPNDNLASHLVALRDIARLPLGEEPGKASSAVTKFSDQLNDNSEILSSDTNSQEGQSLPQPGHIPKAPYLFTSYEQLAQALTDHPDRALIPGDVRPLNDYRGVAQFYQLIDDLQRVVNKGRLQLPWLSKGKISPISLWRSLSIAIRRQQDYLSPLLSGQEYRTIRCILQNAQHNDAIKERFQKMTGLIALSEETGHAAGTLLQLFAGEFGQTFCWPTTYRTWRLLRPRSVRVAVDRRSILQQVWEKYQDKYGYFREAVERLVFPELLNAFSNSTPETFTLALHIIFKEGPNRPGSFLYKQATMLIEESGGNLKKLRANLAVLPARTPRQDSARESDGRCFDVALQLAPLAQDFAHHKRTGDDRQGAIADMRYAISRKSASSSPADVYFGKVVITEKVMGGVLRGVHRDVNVKLAQFFNRQAPAYIKYLNTKYSSLLVNIAQDTFSYLNRLFDFRLGLKLYVESIRSFIIGYLHKLSSLYPIRSNNYNLVFRTQDSNIYLFNCQLTSRPSSPVEFVKTNEALSVQVFLFGSSMVGYQFLLSEFIANPFFYQTQIRDIFSYGDLFKGFQVIWLKSDKEVFWPREFQMHRSKFIHKIRETVSIPEFRLLLVRIEGWYSTLFHISLPFFYIFLPLGIVHISGCNSSYDTLFFAFYNYCQVSSALGLSKNKIPTISGFQNRWPVVTGFFNFLWGNTMSIYMRDIPLVPFEAHYPQITLLIALFVFYFIKYSFGCQGKTTDRVVGSRSSSPVEAFGQSSDDRLWTIDCGLLTNIASSPLGVLYEGRENGRRWTMDDVLKKDLEDLTWYVTFIIASRASKDASSPAGPRPKVAPGADGIVEEVLYRMRQGKQRSPYTIGIGGAPAVGKTTLAKDSLSPLLLEHGRRSLLLDQDDLMETKIQRKEIGTEWDERRVRLKDLRYVLQQIKSGEKVIHTQRYNRRHPNLLDLWTIMMQDIDVVLVSGLYVVSSEKRLGRLLEFIDLPVYLEADLSDIKRWRFEQEENKPHPRSFKEMLRHWEEGIVPDLRRNIWPSRLNARFIIKLDSDHNLKVLRRPLPAYFFLRLISRVWGCPLVSKKVILKETKPKGRSSSPVRDSQGPGVSLIKTGSSSGWLAWNQAIPKHAKPLTQELPSALHMGYDVLYTRGFDFMRQPRLRPDILISLLRLLRPNGVVILHHSLLFPRVLRERFDLLRREGFVQLSRGIRYNAPQVFVKMWRAGSGEDSSVSCSSPVGEGTGKPTEREIEAYRDISKIFSKNLSAILKFFRILIPRSPEIPDCEGRLRQATSIFLRLNPNTSISGTFIKGAYTMPLAVTISVLFFALIESHPIAVAISAGIVVMLAPVSKTIFKPLISLRPLKIVSTMIMLWGSTFKGYLFTLVLESEGITAWWHVFGVINQSEAFIGDRFLINFVPIRAMCDKMSRNGPGMGFIEFIHFNQEPFFAIFESFTNIVNPLRLHFNHPILKIITIDSKCQALVSIYTSSSAIRQKTLSDGEAKPRRIAAGSPVIGLSVSYLSPVIYSISEGIQNALGVIWHNAPQESSIQLVEGATKALQNLLEVLILNDHEGIDKGADKLRDALSWILGYYNEIKKWIQDSPQVLLDPRSRDLVEAVVFLYYGYITLDYIVRLWPTVQRLGAAKPCLLQASHVSITQLSISGETGRVDVRYKITNLLDRGDKFQSNTAPFDFSSTVEDVKGIPLAAKQKELLIRWHFVASILDGFAQFERTEDPDTQRKIMKFLMPIVIDAEDNSPLWSLTADQTPPLLRALAEKVGLFPQCMLQEDRHGSPRPNRGGSRGSSSPVDFIIYRGRRNKELVSEIMNINPGGPPIDFKSLKDVDRYVEIPLRKAARLLFKKGIRTTYSPANYCDLIMERMRDVSEAEFYSPIKHHADLTIDYGCLSDSNQRIADELVQGRRGVEDVEFDFAEGFSPSFTIVIPITDDTPWREVERKSMAVARAFRYQNLSLWRFIDLFIRPLRKLSQERFVYNPKKQLKERIGNIQIHFKQKTAEPTNSLRLSTEAADAVIYSINTYLKCEGVRELVTPVFLGSTAHGTVHLSSDLEFILLVDEKDRLAVREKLASLVAVLREAGLHVDENVFHGLDNSVIYTANEIEETLTIYDYPANFLFWTFVYPLIENSSDRERFSSYKEVVRKKLIEPDSLERQIALLENIPLIKEGIRDTDVESFLSGEKTWGRFFLSVLSLINLWQFKKDQNHQLPYEQIDKRHRKYGQRFYSLFPDELDLPVFFDDSRILMAFFVLMADQGYSRENETWLRCQAYTFKETLEQLQSIRLNVSHRPVLFTVNEQNLYVLNPQVKAILIDVRQMALDVIRVSKELIGSASHQSESRDRVQKGKVSSSPVSNIVSIAEKFVRVFSKFDKDDVVFEWIGQVGRDNPQLWKIIDRLLDESSNEEDRTWPADHSYVKVRYQNEAAYREALRKLFLRYGVSRQAQKIELGSGGGSLYDLAPVELHDYWVAIDIDIEALHVGVDHRGVKHSLVARAQELPILPSSIEVVLALEFLDSVSQEAHRKIIHEVHRVLKGGGKALFIQDQQDYYSDGLLIRLKILSSMLLQQLPRELLYEPFNWPRVTEKEKRYIEDAYEQAHDVDKAEIAMLREAIQQLQTIRQGRTRRRQVLNFACVLFARIDLLARLEGFELEYYRQPLKIKKVMAPYLDVFILHKSSKTELHQSAASSPAGVLYEGRENDRRWTIDDGRWFDSALRLAPLAQDFAHHKWTKEEAGEAISNMRYALSQKRGSLNLGAVVAGRSTNHPDGPGRAFLASYFRLNHNHSDASKLIRPVVFIFSERIKGKPALIALARAPPP